MVEPDRLMPETLTLAHDSADADSTVVQAYKEFTDTGYATTLEEALPREHERSVAHARALSGDSLRSGTQAAGIRNRTQLG